MFSFSYFLPSNTLKVLELINETGKNMYIVLLQPSFSGGEEKCFYASHRLYETRPSL